MPKKQTKKPSLTTVKSKKSHLVEKDSTYFMKLVMFLVFGAFWVHIETSTQAIPVPVGFLIGLFFASHDHFRMDRKIEYAVLLVAMFITYFLDPRIVIAL